MRICTRLAGNYKHAFKQMITAICCSLFLFAANAQDTASIEQSYLDLSLEELLNVKVKSASFFESNVLTVGSSVGVIERVDWEQKGVRRTLDAIAQEPSVMLLPSLFGLNVIAIRGYAQVGSARGIATVLDGIPMNGPYFGTGQYLAQNINLGVLDRIEVIRGAGSSLYGTDAFHGVLSMSTFESEEDLTRVSFEGGTIHYYQGSLQHSAKLGANGRLDFALGVSGEHMDRSYQARDLNTLEVGEFNPDESYQSQTGSLKLTLNPTPRLKIKGGLYLDNYDAYNYPASFYTVSESDWNSLTMAGQLSATQSFAQGRTLEARIYHMRNHSPRSFTRRFGALGVINQTNSLREERTGTSLTFRQPETERWRTEYAVSVGFERASFTEGSNSQIPFDPTIPPDHSELGGVGQYRDITHLLLDARTVLNHWSVIYGGRVDHYSDVATQFSPRLGIVYQPVNNTAIKLIYQRAFRAPTIGEQYSIEPFISDLDPEILNSYELIFLKQSANWKAEFVLFQNDWKDGILVRLDPSLPWGFIYENSGKNQARGIEASLGWYPVHWRIDLSGSYVKSRNLKVDKDYDLFPPIMINLGVARSFESIGLDIFLNNRYFNGAQDIAYNATLLSTPEDLPAYWRTDLTVTKHFAFGMDVFMNILNLFDRDNRFPSVLGLPGGVQDYSFSVSGGLRYTF